MGRLGTRDTEMVSCSLFAWWSSCFCSLQIPLDLLSPEKEKKKETNYEMKRWQCLPLLFQPEELTSSLHTFKNKAFKKSKVCGVCKQIIDGQGISCRGKSVFMILLLINPKQNKQKTKPKLFSRSFRKLDHGIPLLSLCIPLPPSPYLAGANRIYTDMCSWGHFTKRAEFPDGRGGSSL